MIQYKQLEIGDKVLVTTVFTKYMYTIEKVTKTKAIGRADQGFTIEFKREYVFPDRISPWKREKYDTTERKLIK